MIYRQLLPQLDERSPVTPELTPHTARTPPPHTARTQQENPFNMKALTEP